MLILIVAIVLMYLVGAYLMFALTKMSGGIMAVGDLLTILLWPGAIPLAAVMYVLGY